MIGQEGERLQEKDKKQLENDEAATPSTVLVVIEDNREDIEQK
jgi:hypothetical protein